ncbi:MAG: hypothetical protein DRI83_09125, partial [Bacteroidetes bacterium]
HIYLVKIPFKNCIPILGSRKFGKETLWYTEIENTKTGFTKIRPESSIVLFNEKGSVLWSAL